MRNQPLSGVLFYTQQVSRLNNNFKLVFICDYFQNLILLWAYVLIYNLALLPIFLVFFQLITSNVKTVNYFGSFSLSYFLNKVLLIAILSAAGVPPFIGFFSKIFIFTLLCNSNFSFLFILFFILLFTSLYFYIQNVRFINSSNVTNSNTICDKNTRLVLKFYYFTFPNLFLIIFGNKGIEDIFIFIKWLIL